jgi:hypothetical protein
MSRTTLCVVTAGVLATLSLGLMIVRWQVLGKEVRVPAGPDTWKVTLAVKGQSLGDARLQTATPLDCGRQHVLREACHSKELFDKPPEARHPERRQVLWTQRGGTSEGAFRLRYDFYCTIDVYRPSAAMSRLHRSLYAAPQPGQYLDAEQVAASGSAAISATARRLTAKLDRPADQAEALYRFVDQDVTNEPNLGGPATSAADCLQNGSGDSGGKARLLVALLRNRGIPARLATGLTLTRGAEQLAHHWVEAWINDQWLSMCPFHHHYGQVPPTYLVFGFGDLPVVHGRHVKDVEYAFLVEKVSREEALGTTGASWLRRTLLAMSFHALPPPEQRLVEFLLLLPVAGLIICVYRNLIGLYSFGTFAPALLGLAFRELNSLPGLLVFVSILLIGWVMRRVLDWYHLLQVPRVAVLLSLVVIVLISAVVAANFQDWPATRYVPLFPMVILTGMIERFWTLEVEDSTVSSFKTLFCTMVISLSIALVVGLPAVVNQMFYYPETLGVIMAVQMLIGRYTGYRLLELFRFRDFLRHETALS